MTTNTTDEDMLAIETAFAALIAKLSEEGFTAYASAAVMTKLAFMIYKSTMTPENYNLMIDEISNSRDRIKSFNELEQKGRLN